MEEVRRVRVLDRDFGELDRLRPEKAGISMKKSGLDTAEMVLREAPWAEPEQYFELFVPGRSAGIYRVSRIENLYMGYREQRIYLEHISAMLSDRVMLGYHEARGSAAHVLEYVLSFQDRWSLGGCEAEAELDLSFENMDVCAAVEKVLENLPGFYIRYDCTAWKIHVLSSESAGICELRLSRNADKLTVREDLADMCTRIYPLGYGEGADKQGIGSINGGKPYMDARTLGTYGLREKIWSDTDADTPERLMAGAMRELNGRKAPCMSLEADAECLDIQTGEDLDRFGPGRACRVCLPEEKRSVTMEITEMSWQDVYGKPLSVSLRLSRGESLASMLSGMAGSLERSELSSQGSASTYAVHFGDNADETCPAELSFYVDEDMIRVNFVRVRYVLKPFRGYTKSESGGGRGSVVADGISAKVQVPAQDLQTGYPISGAAEGKHYHLAQTVNQTLTVKILSSALEKALDIGEHVHRTVFGIFMPPSTVTGVRIRVDGQEIPGTFGESGEFDALPYLTKDGDRVRRGCWHTVSFQPEGLARVEADVHVRTFIRTLTGAGM